MHIAVRGEGAAIEIFNILPCLCRIKFIATLQTITAARINKSMTAKKLDRRSVKQGFAFHERNENLLELGLPAAHSNLGVPSASHGPLVNIGTANIYIGVIHNHHLAMDIDHLPHGLAEHLP